MLKRILSKCGVLAIACLSACSGGGGGISQVPNSIVPAQSPVGASPSNTTSSRTPDLVATTTTTTTTAPMHVNTADYFRGYAGTFSVPNATAAQYLTWAETQDNSGDGLHAVGIKTLEYLDPFRQSTTDPLYNSNASTFAHNCGGSDVIYQYVGGTSNVTQYLMNPGSSALVTLLNNWEAKQEAAGHIDAFFFDNVDDLYGTVAPCGMSNATWDAENETFIQQSAHPVVFSGYALSSDAQSLIKASNVLGGVVEECYDRVSQPTIPYTTGTYWVQDENLQLAAAAAGKQYFCYNNVYSAGSSEIPLRKYVYASFLISYAPASSVLWESFTTTPSEFHVFPETTFVPTTPRVAAPASVNSLVSATGLYFREYETCYLGGRSVGRCVAIVNPDPSSSRKLPGFNGGTYSHTLVISGGGVVDGGTVSASGPAPPATIPPETGIIAIQ